MGTSKGAGSGGRKGKRGPRTDNRRFLNALLWMARSGSRWRDLPARLGDYHTVKRRYYRWIAMGVLEVMFEALAGKPIWIGGPRRENDITHAHALLRSEERRVGKEGRCRWGPY